MARKAKFQTVQLDITQYDINHGTRGDGSLCPIARSAKRTFKSLFNKKFLKTALKTLNVTSDIEFAGPEETYNLALSAKANKFIGTFDDEGKKASKPFSFKIKVPVEALA